MLRLFIYNKELKGGKLMSEVGQRIKELRKSKGLTQQDLSEGVVTRSYLSQIEKGTVEPSYDTLKNLAEKLGCQVETFYEAPQNKALLLNQLKKNIKFIEERIESGQIEEAIKIYSNLKIEDFYLLDQSDLGVLCWIRGTIEQHQHFYNEATETFNQSISYLEKTSNKKALMRSIDSLSNLHLQTGKNKKAFNLLNDAYANLIQYQMGCPLKVSILISLAYSNMNFAEYYSAIRFLKEANSINKATNIYVKAGQIFLLLALCYKETAQFTKAEEANNKALHFFIIAEDEESKASVYNNLANLYLTNEKNELAIEYFLKSISIFEALNHTKGLLLAKTGLAKAYQQAGEYESSEKICQQIVSQPNKKQYIGYAFLILGEIEIERVDFSKAQNFFLKSLKTFQEEDIKWGIVAASKKQAQTFFKQEEYQKAAILYNDIITEEAKYSPPLFI